MALAQLLPNLRADLLLSREQGGWLVAFVNLGTMLAYFWSGSPIGWVARLFRSQSSDTRSVPSQRVCTGRQEFCHLSALARLFLIAEWRLRLSMPQKSFPCPARHGDWRDPSIGQSGGDPLFGAGALAVAFAVGLAHGLFRGGSAAHFDGDRQTESAVKPRALLPIHRTPN